MGYLKRTLNAAPQFFAALYALGELNVLAGDFDEAAKYYRQAVLVHPDPGLFIKLGVYSEKTGNYQEAAKYYQRVIKTSPSFFVGYNQLAWLYAKQDINLSEAMTLAQKADQLQPGNASILDTIGWIHYQQKQYSAAIPFLEKSLSVNQHNPIVYYHLGRAFLAYGKEDKGVANLKRALALSTSFDGAEEAKKLLKKNEGPE